MKKILVIDDNESDLKLIEIYLKKEGEFEVLLANTGEEGLKLVQSFRPDMVITDTNLPTISGFEICRRIKETEGLDIKVIIMTGHIDSVDAGKAREMGCDECCVKTADFGELIQTVKNCFAVP